MRRVSFSDKKRAFIDVKSKDILDKKKQRLLLKIRHHFGYERYLLREEKFIIMSKKRYNFVKVDIIFADFNFKSTFLNEK